MLRTMNAAQVAMRAAGAYSGGPASSVTIMRYTMPGAVYVGFSTIAKSAHTRKSGAAAGHQQQARGIETEAKKEEIRPNDRSQVTSQFLCNYVEQRVTLRCGKSVLSSLKMFGNPRMVDKRAGKIPALTLYKRVVQTVRSPPVIVPVELRRRPTLPGSLSSRGDRGGVRAALVSFSAFYTRVVALSHRAPHQKNETCPLTSYRFLNLNTSRALCGATSDAIRHPAVFCPHVPAHCSASGPFRRVLLNTHALTT